MIDVSDRLKVADWFIVCTGQNRAHVRALVDELHVRLKAVGQQHRPLQGADLGWWVILDYSDVVIHVQQPDAREYYDIERLYEDCARLDWSAEEPPALPSPHPAGPAEAAADA